MMKIHIKHKVLIKISKNFTDSMHFYSVENHYVDQVLVSF